MILVRTGTESTTDKWPKVPWRESTYQYVLLAVQGSLCQYKAVRGNTRQYMIARFLVRNDSMLARTGTSEYILHGWPAGFCAWNFALLKALISQTVQADTPMHAQTGLFIRHPCQLPWHPSSLLAWLRLVVQPSANSVTIIRYYSSKMYFIRIIFLLKHYFTLLN